MDITRHIGARLLKRPNVKIKDARAAWREYRVAAGSGGQATLLTHPAANRKLSTNGAYGLSLAPNTTSGVGNCRYATPSCIDGCVGEGGLAFMPKVRIGRALKSLFLADHPEMFVTLLAAELHAVWRKNTDTEVRLNVFSDIPWERLAPWLFDELASAFPGGECPVYDYTKWTTRESTPRYKLTYSASERTTDTTITRWLANGRNVAVVFDTKKGEPLPASYLAWPVIDGDATDGRWYDPSGVVVGLRAKGLMRHRPVARLMVRNA